MFMTAAIASSATTTLMTPMRASCASLRPLIGAPSLVAPLLVGLELDATQLSSELGESGDLLGDDAGQLDVGVGPADEVVVPGAVGAGPGLVGEHLGQV